MSEARSYNLDALIAKLRLDMGPNGRCWVCGHGDHGTCRTCPSNYSLMEALKLARDGGNCQAQFKALIRDSGIEGRERLTAQVGRHPEGRAGSDAEKAA